MTTEERISDLEKQIERLKHTQLTQDQFTNGVVKQRFAEGNFIFSGLAANIPDGSKDVKTYYATDTNTLYVWNGSWQSITISNSNHPTEPDWTAPTLLNSWVNLGSPWEVTGYYKDSSGIVHIRGLVQNGTIGAYSVFVLPDGYRPYYNVIVSTASNQAFGELVILQTGEVQAYSGSNIWISLNCSFRTYQ